ncbi:MAG: restriction endonuclease [Proteobacteria bacterium]|nr:restriction endonuclease [Pseudomonadota bacterium]
MKIAEFHSHLNGWEHVSIHRPVVWEEIRAVIAAIEPDRLSSDTPGLERQSAGPVYYSSGVVRAFRTELVRRGWTPVASSCRWRGTADPKASPGRKHPDTVEETDFMKDRFVVGAQFGRPASVAYDLVARHMAFFIGDKIDVGIELLPMKAMQAEMSSGVAYYEGELYNLLRQGRGTPAVPLVMVGVMP